MPRAHRTFSSLSVEDMMVPNPVTVGSTSTVQDAADLMIAADVRHIPVVMHGTLVGMISDRDLRSYMLPRPEKVLHADEARTRMAASVSAVMRTDVITVHPDTPVAALIDILLEEKCWCGARAGPRYWRADWDGQLYRCTPGDASVYLEERIRRNDNLSCARTSCPLCPAFTGHRPAQLPRLARPSGSRVLARILLLHRGKRHRPQPGAGQDIPCGGYR